MDAFTTLTGLVAPLDRPSRRYRPNHSEAVPETIKRTGLRKGCWRLAATKRRIPGS